MKAWALLLTGLLPLSAIADSEFDGDENFSESEEELDFEGFYGDDDFVSISTGTKKTISRAPSVASVITARQIKENGAITLAEALSRIPGLHVARAKSLMSHKYIFRGISSRFNPQTLVLVNGSPISSIVRGDRHSPIGEFPLHGISRIEVIRGPGSAIHGADAFAGVINIITKDFDDIKKMELGVSYGSFKTTDVWANHSFSVGDLKVALLGEYISSDGHKEEIASDAQTNLDALGDALGLNVPHVSYAPGPVNLSYRGWDLRLNAKYNDFSLRLGFQDRDNIGTGQGVAKAIDPDGKFGSEKMQILLDYKRELSEFWKTDISFSHYRSNQRVEETIKLLPDGTIFGAFPDGLSGNPEWKEQTHIFQPKFSYSGFDGHLISIGFGYRESDLKEVTETKNFGAGLVPLGGLVDVSDTLDVYMPEGNRSSGFGFIQDEFKLAADWELTAALRYDDYSDFGSTTNPRLALVWATDRNLSTKLLYGKAFRAPGFAEQIVVNNPSYLGNKNIKPETIDTYELAFNYQASTALHIDLNFFKFFAKKVIEWVPDANASTRTAQNIGSVDGYGFETELTYDVTSNMKIYGNYAYHKVTDRASDYHFGGGAPQHSAYISLDWNINESVTMNFYTAHNGKIHRNSYDLREPVQSFTDVGMFIKFDNIFSGYNLSLKATNLLDDEHKEPSEGPSAGSPSIDIPYDLPQAGRALTVSLSKQF